MHQTAALAHVHDIDAVPRPRRTFPADALSALNTLRLTALRCRSAARLDLFRACAVLAMERDRNPEVFADALIRTLGQGLGRSPNFLRPGCEERTFDEEWLLALFLAIRSGDDASATFLLDSRIDRSARRSLGFLIGRLAEHLDELPSASSYGASSQLTPALQRDEMGA